MRCVAITPDGRIVLSGGDDSDLRLWDTQTGAPLQIYTLPKNPITISLSRDGRYALVGMGSKLNENHFGSVVYFA